MKKKSIFISLIIVLFFVVTVFLVFATFTINNVNAKISVSEKGEVFYEELEPKLNSYVGKNLVFINTDEIKELIEQNPYFEVTKVEKAFPNTINIEFFERREVYILEYEHKSYLLSETGIVLSEITSPIENERNLIRINYKDVDFYKDVAGYKEAEIEKLEIGSKVVFDRESLLYTFTTLANSVDLTDCIKGMSVYLMESTGVDAQIGQKQVDVSFYTYSGVEIVVKDAENFGIEKVIDGFNYYDTEGQLNDYYKSVRKIEVRMLDDGNIESKWTSKY